MKGIIILIAVLALVSSQPKLQVYVESLCENCINFEISNIKQLRENPSRSLLVSSLEIIPFGNAFEDATSKPGKRSFHCQHGPKECYGNTILNCSFNKLNSQDDNESFAICFSEEINRETRFESNLDEITRNCLTERLDIAESILECANGPEGGELMHAAALKTRQHTYVPYVMVDGVHTEDIEEQVEDNLVKYLCQKAKLVNKVPGCMLSELEAHNYSRLIKFLQ